MNKYWCWSISLSFSVLTGILLWFSCQQVQAELEGTAQLVASFLLVAWYCFHAFFHLFVVPPQKLKDAKWKFSHLRPYVNKNMIVFAVKMIGYLSIIGFSALTIAVLPTKDFVSISFGLCSIPIALFYIMAVSQLYQTKD